MRSKKRLVTLGLSGVAMLSLLATAFFLVTRNSQASPSSTSGVVQHAQYVGTTSMHSSAPSATSTGTIDLDSEIRQETEVDEDIPHSGHGALRVPADHTPKPTMSGIVTDSTAPGFSGLTHAQQRLADNGNQFSLVPPDQALCVGNGFVLESVNTALRVYNTDGTPAGDVIAINPFFHLPSEIVRGDTLVFGDFTSDPKCYYDAPTDRWFLTILQANVDSATGAFTGPTSVMIAVSQSGDPTGDWNIFKLDTTDGDGSLPGHPDCPCLGDQPLIGADANGFYVSTNEFPLFTGGFNGAQIYAISKSKIVAATSGASLDVVHINAGTIPVPSSDPGGIWYSVQPATAPGSHYASNTEYFMSSLQFGPGALDNRIAVWALTHTNALDSANPADVSLSHVVIDSEVYGQPPDSAQKDGPLFLASNMEALTGIKTPPTEHLEFLAGNDDRMNQVVFADGKLWSGVNTVVSGNGPTRVGIAYFIVTPSVANDTVSATMTKQGYVALNQNDVLYPSIGVNDQGKGVMTFTVAGPNYYPSAGYAKIDATNGAGAVHIAAAGAGPDDSFGGYHAFGGDGTDRWGDYSAAVADENGEIWFACEYIPDAPRTALANWGTFVGHVMP